MTNNIITCVDVKQNRFTEEPIVWLGDNLGSEGEVFVYVKSQLKEFFLSLEEARRVIDLFVEYGRNRILRALASHFYLEAV